MSKYNGLWFFYDDDISIYWNRSETFTVWNSGKEVNCFTVPESMTPEQAEENADEWLAEQLEEEKLCHAEDLAEEIEFQFESPDLFSM